MKGLYVNGKTIGTQKFVHYIEVSVIEGFPAGFHCIAQGEGDDNNQSVEKRASLLVSSWNCSIAAYTEIYNSM